MGHEGDARDSELLARGAYARVLAKWEPTIVGRCVAALHGSLDAEDVAQDVKVRLWSELAKGKSYSVPFRVVVHQVVNWTLRDHWGNRPTHDPLPEWFDPADPSDGIGELLDRDAVASMLDPLKGRTREVMELFYLDRLDHEQIAEQLGMTRNAVDQALHRGHTKLREIFLA